MAFLNNAAAASFSPSVCLTPRLDSSGIYKQHLNLFNFNLHEYYQFALLCAYSSPYLSIMTTTTPTSAYPCTSMIPNPAILLQLQPRDIQTSTLASPTSTSTSIHLSSTQMLREEFWPYGGGVLIAFLVCAIIFGAIWFLDMTYQAKEFGLNLLVWIWGTWWTIVFWPFQMLAKINRVLNRGLGRDRDGRPRIPREMEEC